MVEKASKGDPGWTKRATRKARNNLEERPGRRNLSEQTSRWSIVETKKWTRSWDQEDGGGEGQ